YQFIAEANLAKGNKPAAVGILTQYRDLGGGSPQMLRQLAALEEEAGNTKEAAATLERINYIYPVNDESLHRHLGDLWFDQKNYAGPIRQDPTAAACNPLD